MRYIFILQMLFLTAMPGIVAQQLVKKYTAKGIEIKCLNDGKIELDEKEHVLACTLAENQYFFNGKNAAVYCRAKYPVQFFPSGVLKTAFLSRDQVFFNGRYKEVYLLQGRKVEFYENGTLKSGFLNRNQIFQNGRKQDVSCLMGTKIVFYPSGNVQFCTLDSNHKFYNRNKKAFLYHKNEVVFLTDQGFIN